MVVYAFYGSLACVLSNAVMIATEYIGELFGKSYEEDNVKRKVITLLVALVAAAVTWLCAYVPFVSNVGIVQVVGYILTVITFGMQTFYVWI